MDLFFYGKSNVEKLQLQLEFLSDFPKKLKHEAHIFKPIFQKSL